MKKLLPYISALGIILFIYFLLPPGREVLSNIGEDVTEKKETVVSDYNDLKDNVVNFTDKVEDTQKKLEDTVEKVNETKKSVEALNEKMQYFLQITESMKEVTEPWQQSDPKLDPSLEAGRSNYNYANPGEDGLSKAHLELDIKPWIEWGSSEKDDSTKEERIKMLSETQQGQKMLDKLGYDY